LLVLVVVAGDNYLELLVCALRPFASLDDMVSIYLEGYERLLFYVPLAGSDRMMVGSEVVRMDITVAGKPRRANECA
jgi:hypothetical protein